MGTHSRHIRRGFTLAESLLASVVLAVSVCAIAAAMTTSFSQAGRVDKTGAALLICRQLHEEIAAKTFDQVAAMANQPLEDRIVLADGSQYDLPPGFTRSLEIIRRGTPSGAPSANGDYLLVIVNVKIPSGEVVKLKRMIVKDA
jgi:prepilin-type N-terminal cleavage/methylation domain-containing protein